MIKTLKLNKIARNLTLIAAGAFMATLVVVPFTTSADEEDNDLTFESVATTSIFTIEASDGVASQFTLVENDGQLVLTLMEAAPQIFLGEDDDDE